MLPGTDNGVEAGEDMVLLFDTAVKFGGRVNLAAPGSEGTAWVIVLVVGICLED